MPVEGPAGAAPRQLPPAPPQGREFELNSKKEKKEPRHVQVVSHRFTREQALAHAANLGPGAHNLNGKPGVLDLDQPVMIQKRKQRNPPGVSQPPRRDPLPPQPPRRDPLPPQRPPTSVAAEPAKKPNILRRAFNHVLPNNKK
jgi:hypothetical protein